MATVETEQLQGKNWVATMMLCWTLGMYGAHRFYTGKSGTAWAMAILTLTGCFSFVSLIWMVIDGIMIALGKWTHEDGSELYERIPWLGVVYIVLVVLALLFILFYFGSIIALIGMIGTSGAGAGAGY